MAFFSKDIDSALQGAGAKPGLEIWCVENLRLVPVPRSSHGKFYSGSAYLVLNTILPKSGSPLHDIHYWLGSNAIEVDLKLVSDKALELDAALGSCAVQYREIEGQETGKFLSYFKPCIIPLEGVFSSQSGKSNGETYRITLFTCKGDHVVRVKEVPFSRSSLNHNDVFVLDSASKIFLFSGCNSTIQERAKALEVVQYIKENNHGGNCEVATIEDGKLVGDPDVGEFWSLFGGYAPIPRDTPSANQQQPETMPVKLFLITTQKKLVQAGTNSLNKDALDKDKCYFLDCNTEGFVWLGRATMVTERKISISAVEDFLREQGRSNGTHLAFLTEGLETPLFRSFFESWPQTVETKLYDEGREKVAAMFKLQGYDVKELPQDDDEPYLNCRGTVKVWRVNGDELSLVPDSEQMKLFSGDCYIVQYSYSDNGRDETLFYAWFGRSSVLDDRFDAICHMSSLLDSIKGDPVIAQVVEDKEPVQFLLIFQTLIVLKGGISARYKTFLVESGLADETYDEQKMALFRVQGTNPNNMQAIQADLVSSSLNSSYCYILQNGTSVFTWIGSLTSAKDHDLLDRMLALINSTWQPISVREGSEPDSFWSLLGGKTEYPREKKMKKFIEDPHLFTCTLNGGIFKAKEIFNFTQDDLTTEDVLILDCHEEIYVWIGRYSEVKLKQLALSIGQKFVETDILVEGLSLETPIYVTTEGHEPSFFTRFFEWDPSKVNVHGNSFERKLALLKGQKQAPIRNSWKPSSREATPQASRSASPAPMLSSPSFNHNVSISSTTPLARALFSGSFPSSHSQTELSGSPVPKQDSLNQDDGNEINLSSVIFPYERLKVGSSDTAEDIDVTKREVYLSKEEFEKKFGMTRGAFYKLPKWRQNKMKMALDLF